jgi:hypothetical protein
MGDEVHIRGLDIGDADPASLCQVHDWPMEGLARRLVDAMREMHGRGGINVCVKCIERAKASLPRCTGCSHAPHLDACKWTTSSGGSCPCGSSRPEA